MAKSLRTVWVILIIYFASVNCEDPPTSIDKVILDYVEATNQFWTSIDKRTENVLANAEKRFGNINLDGEDEISLLIKVEDIGKKGKQISEITRDLFYGVYQRSIKASSEFHDKITKLRNVTTMLNNITLHDGFWEAALETASVARYKYF